MNRHEAPHAGHLGRDWWGPLEDLVERVADDPRRRFLDLDDFQVELRVHRSPRPRVLVYRHLFTRRVIHLDAEGEAYRFIPYRDSALGTGQYRRHRSVDEALDALAMHGWLLQVVDDEGGDGPSGWGTAPRRPSPAPVGRPALQVVGGTALDGEVDDVDGW